MLVSARKFGGCAGVKYDCAVMNVAALLATYTNHSTAANPPPEGGPEFVKYTACCIRSQCQGGPACGLAPNTIGMRLFDAEMPSMTKPASVMMLAACAAAFFMAASGIACVVVRLRRSSRTPSQEETSLE